MKRLADEEGADERGLMAALKELAIEKGVPAHLTEGITWYVYRGRPMGSFLAAVFANDFMNAVCQADPGSLAGIQPLAKFIYNDLPAHCHGSSGAIAAWIDRGGDPQWRP